MANILIQQISTPGCPTCVWAKDFFDKEVKPNFSQIKIEHIDALTPAGRQLVKQYGIFTAPGIIINGELFSSGSFDKEIFLQKIQSLPVK